MSWLDGVRHRLRVVVRPGTWAADLEEEVRIHRELDAQEQGDAQRARRRFGNELWYREEVRRMTWLGTLDTLRQDATHAWRSIARSPGLTVVVVVMLALGIGVNAAMFTLLDRLYLRAPGGVADPGAVRRVWVEHVMRAADGVPFASQVMNYPMYRLVAEAAGDPGRSAVYMPSSRQRLGREAGAPRAWLVHASANLFPLLGVQPALGRFYTEDEDRLGAGAEVAVISDLFWRHHFDADPGVLGSTLMLGSQQVTIIGVAPPSFTGLELQPTDIWTPLASMPTQGPATNPPWWESTSSYAFRALIRTDPAHAAAFEQRATALIRNLNREQTPNRPDTLMNVYAGSIIEARGPGRTPQELTISTRLGGVSVIVLLIACANVINLLLARAMQRSRENAVRLALGISRWRMMRMVTAETLVLAFMAGIAAMFAASWGGSFLRSLLLPDIEWAGGVLDPRILVFGAGLTLATGLAAGIVPAVQSSRSDVTTALNKGPRQGVRHRSLLRSGLVVAQTALTVMLLIGAALFVRSLHNVQDLEIGYDADRLIFGGLEFAVGETPPAPILAATLRDVAERLDRRPGVASVALANMRPMYGFSFTDFYTATDSSQSFSREFPTFTAVSPSYFRTVGLRVVRGRVFEEGSSEGAAPEVVVNEAMARLVWPGQEAVGECMYFEARDNPCARVVGIVEDARLGRIIEDAPAPQFYLSLGNMPVAGRAGTTIIARAAQRSATAAAAELREELRQAFPAALVRTTPMREQLEPQYRPWRIGATLFTAFGLLGLLVALVGIYTTVSYGVTQRAHEFGVRIALGARVADVLRLILGEGLRVAFAGVIVGVVLALAAGRLVAALLFGVESHDPAALTLVSVILLGVAALAALLPAWRAARIDPLATLREE